MVGVMVKCYAITISHVFMGYIDVGDEMCWWQIKDVGDGFGNFVR